MDTETTGAPEGVTEETTLVQQVEAAIAADAPEQVEQPADDAGAEQPPAKPRKSAQERIDELTAARREAEREAEYWRSRATQQQPSAPAPAPPQDGEPDPAAYEYGETDARFIRDHATFHARLAAREEFQQQQAVTRQQTALSTFQTRVAAQYPDGPPAGLLALQRAPQLSTGITDVILASENGPKLADHLGTNPGELQRLSALPPTLQAYELAKLESRLAAPPAPQPKTVTNAPSPTPQVRGAGGQFQVAPDTNDTGAFLEMARRKLGT